MARSWFNGMECDRLCFHGPDMERGSGSRNRKGEGEERREAGRGADLSLHL